MVAMNLLPWREEKEKREREKIKKILIFTLLIHSILWVSVVLFLLTQIRHIKHQILPFTMQLESFQPKNMNFISSQNPEIRKEWEMKSSAQNKLFHLLATLSEKPSRPPSLCFKQITQDEKGIIFIGDSSSISSMLNYWHHWQAMQQFSLLQIEKLDQQQDGMIHFQWRGYFN